MEKEEKIVDKKMGNDGGWKGEVNENGGAEKGRGRWRGRIKPEKEARAERVRDRR